MNKTKKSLLMSAISLLLCISMLLGSTFAWFTDQVNSAGNKIQSGTLKIDLELLDKETGKWNSLKKTSAPLFDYEKWEPGYTETKILKVENEGNLALKWVTKLYSEKQLSILADVIDVYVRTSKTEIGYPTDRNLEGYTCVGNLRTFVNSVEETTWGTLEAKEASYLGFALKMREEAGNEYQGLDLGGAFDIRIYATQYTSENDSFGNMYDILADESIVATQTKTLVAGASSIDFELTSKGITIAKVIVPASAIADTSKPVTVTFDGIDPEKTIEIGSNTKAYAYDISVTNLKDGLEGEQLIELVITAPNALAAMNAYHNGVKINGAVYDEVAGTITFKTANFSPYAFSYTEMQVSTLEALREAVKQSNVEIKLNADLTIDLTKGTGAARNEEHVLVSGSSKYYNAVNIVGQNVAIDLNGHKITAFCGDAYNSNSDVGALFFVKDGGSLNIIDRAGGGFIKMRSSIYAVWAPYDTPSYVDIYNGIFIADSYAGDPIGTSTDPDSADGTMKNENSNRALIYAGFGGNMNIYGGYYLYNNTPNDVLDRNNGAFNAKDFYEGSRALITIHDGVKLTNEKYRQDPTYTSRPDGSYDNYSVKLAKDCEIAKLDSAGVIVIDGKAYSSWYSVIKGVSSISATAKKNVYNVGYEFTTDDFQVYAFSANGTSGTITNFTISKVDTSTPGTKTVTITYTKDGSALTAQCNVQIMSLGDSENTIKAPNGNNPLYQQYFNAGNFNVSGWANMDGDINGNKIAEPSYANMVGKTFEGLNGEIVTGFNLDVVNGAYGENYYDLTIKNAKQYTTLGINCLVAYEDVSNPIKGFGCYINDDLSTLTWNTPAIVYIGSNQAPGNLPGTSYQVNDDIYNVWGANNAYSLTTTNCANFKAGQTYTVHWVVVFEDGLSELCEWTVTMADLSSNDAMFTDTEKPNANVIIMAGQSNMFGASPLTQTIKNQYAGHNFSNVFIKYNNINFDVNSDGSLPGTLSTVFQNNDFQRYQLGIGGQSNNYFGPETALAEVLSTADSLKDKQWFIIKYAAAGTALSSQWTSGCKVNGKDTNLTDDMLTYVQSAIDELSSQYDVQVQSFMWMQGESDAINKTTAEGYAGLEKTLVERVRNRFASYATRTIGSIPGSGISFVNAGIAINDTDLTYSQGGPNDWVWAEIVNAGKISNSQWLCSIVGAGTDSALTAGPLKGYTFGKDKPTIPNPNQGNAIVNSIYIDSHHLLSKLNSTGEHPEYLEGDRTDWAHYGAGAMKELGSLYASCLHYLMLNGSSGPVEHKITFDANGGAVDGDSVVYAYSSVKMKLPNATKTHHTFNGWFNAPTGGDFIGAAGAEYTVNGSTTLYAQWTENGKYTVTYDANGGSVGSASETVYVGESVTLPTPTRTGYTFNGWYTAASSGTKIGNAGAAYKPTANITLYAQWSINSYAIKVSSSNATVKVNGTTVNDGGSISIQYGAQVTVTVDYSEDNNQSTTITGADGTTYGTSFTMPAQEVTINASSQGGCFTSDTLITLADGSKKRADQITYEDQLLVWDFYNGEYTVSVPSAIYNHGDQAYKVTNLKFSDGTVVKMIAEHEFFDVEANSFVYICEDNVQTFVGREFLKTDGSSFKSVTLMGYEYTEEYTGCYTILTAMHYNCFGEGMLSLTSDPSYKCETFFRIFEVGEGMKYDEAKMQADIEKYGLYTYEDFAAYVTYEEYVAFGGAYFKVLVGKGLLEFEDILMAVATYAPSH